MLKQIKKIPLQFYGYLKKDIFLLVKRKKYLYLSILLPLIIAVLFLFMLNPSEAPIKLGVCDHDNSEVSNNAFTDLSGFDSEVIDADDCTKVLVDHIKEGKYSLGIEIEKGFSENLENLKRSKITIYYDNTDVAFSNLVSWKVDSSLYPFQRNIVDNLNTELKKKLSSLRSSVDIALTLTPSYKSLNTKMKDVDNDLKKVEELDTDFLLSPIWTDKKAVYDGKSSKDSGIAFIFPVIALFIVLMLSSTSLIYDKKNRFIVRVKSTTTPITYILSKITFFVLLTLVQFVIILLLFLMYGASYQYNILSILEMILFIGIINSLIGLIIGLISDNEGIALLFSLIISFPLMLLSGAFFPLQTMPAITQYLAKALPLHHEIIAVKSVLIFGSGLGSRWWIIALVLFLVVYLMIKNDE